MSTKQKPRAFRYRVIENDIGTGKEQTIEFDDLSSFLRYFTDKKRTHDIVAENTASRVDVIRKGMRGKAGMQDMFE